MSNPSEHLAPWQRAWRHGIAPQLSTQGLLALKRALERDDPALIQGGTTEPPPLQANEREPVDCACALAFAGWQGEGLETVADVEEYFARTCYEADQALGEPSAVRYFVIWYDETPREEMRRLLIEEVNLALTERRIR